MIVGFRCQTPSVPQDDFITASPNAMTLTLDQSIVYKVEPIILKSFREIWGNSNTPVDKYLAENYLYMH